MNPKLIVFDIDGTLLDSQKEIAPSTLECIELLKRAGHQLAIATGRNFALAKEVIEAVSFNHYICCNGSAAFLNHELVHSSPLDYEGLEQLVRLADKAQLDLIFQGLYGMRRHNEQVGANQLAAMTSFGSGAPDYEANFYQNEPIYQALTFHSEEQDDVYADFKAFDFVRWHEVGVDAIPLGGSKAKTIGILADKLKISLADTIAFGDGDNDREMLKLVGHGIAMGNASQAVQACADEVTASNDEDGIQLALRRLGLI